jgi:hypothetical protein
MPTSKIFWSTAVLVVAGGLTTFSLTLGQGQPTPGQIAPSKGPVEAAARPNRDLSKWSFFQKEIYFSGQRGCEWLQRTNGYDGRFAYSHVPALRSALEPDDFLSQAGAAYALAKASSYYHDEKAAALARQAVLTLLKIDTAVENPNDPTIRVCTLPAGIVNPVAAVARLVRAIHELPAPGSDLLDDSAQLCNYLRRCQHPDGSLAVSDPGQGGPVGPADAEMVNVNAGEALLALMRSQQHRPEPWKIDLVRKALESYRAQWRANKSLALIPRHSAAYAEAYQLTHDQAFADLVFEMNDWLLTFQFHQLDPLHPLWIGGFMSCVEGRATQTQPHAGGAVYVESLAEAARVARLVGDPKRFDRYKEALERGLQFLTTLQYTDASTQHFADWYRPTLVGGIHASHTDSNLRLDYTQEAMGAVLGYLIHVKEVEDGR